VERSWEGNCNCPGKLITRIHRKISPPSHTPGHIPGAAASISISAPSVNSLKKTTQVV